MAIKLRSTISIFLLFVPVLFYVLNAALFELFMFFAVLFVCGKSLYKLIIYNFSSDEFFYSSDAKLQRLQTSGKLMWCGMEVIGGTSEELVRSW